MDDEQKESIRQHINLAETYAGLKELDHASLTQFYRYKACFDRVIKTTRFEYHKVEVRRNLNRKLPLSLWLDLVEVSSEKVKQIPIYPEFHTMEDGPFWVESCEKSQSYSAQRLPGIFTEADRDFFFRQFRPFLGQYREWLEILEKLGRL